MNSPNFILPLLFLSGLMSLPLDDFQALDNDFPDDTEPQQKLSRKQLCPANKSSSLFRYHAPTKTCYKLGEKGPCGGNMVFYSEVNTTVYGDCDCDFMGSKIPLVYHPESDQCYPVYSQAYCAPTHWLTISEATLTPTCRPDPCGDFLVFDSDEETVLVEFNGKCVPLNSKCGNGQVVTFVAGKVVPSCGGRLDGDEFSITVRSVLKTRTLSCKPGSRRDVNGKCRRSITIRPSDDDER